MKINANSYAKIVENFSSGILLLDSDCNIQLWNAFMAEHSGHAEADVVGKDIFTVFPQMSKRWFSTQVQMVLSPEGPSSVSWKDRPHLLDLNSHKESDSNDNRMYQNCNLFSLVDVNEEGAQALVCMVVMDVTTDTLKQLTLQKTLMNLEQISRLDGLTELYNRAYWEGRLTEEFARSRRYPDSADMTLLMFDIDHFKTINDEYGHLAGDQVLQEIAKIVQGLFRNIDIPGRYGGEEFAVILPKTTIEGATVVAERLRQKIEGMVVNFNDSVLSVTVSIGLAQFIPSMKSHQDLISESDAALYEAKSAGRNQVKIARD